MADDESNGIRQRVYLILEQRQLHDAMRVLNDETRDGGLPANTLLVLDMFRGHLNAAVRRRASQDAGNSDDEQRILQDLRQLVIRALLDTVNFRYEQRERVSRSAGVISALETKQTFGAAGGSDHGVTECSICFEEFVDGGQVTVMPCPSHRQHRFHTDCIPKWLEIRNTCPLCRHELSTAGAGAYDDQ